VTSESQAVVGFVVGLVPLEEIGHLPSRQASLVGLADAFHLVLGLLVALDHVRHVNQSLDQRVEAPALHVRHNGHQVQQDIADLQRPTLS
jgi:hypothetical protein